METIITQENKELLLKDLCARLPYNCRVFYEFTDDLSHEIQGYSITLNTHYIWQFANDKGIVKPYLRPLSSMTEEERKEYNDIVKNIIDFIDCPKSDDVCFHIILIDWLNKHHFDYRGLIPMGLAIDCTKLDIDIYDSSIKV